MNIQTRKMLAMLVDDLHNGFPALVSGEGSAGFPHTIPEWPKVVRR